MSGMNDEQKQLVVDLASNNRSLKLALATEIANRDREIANREHYKAQLADASHALFNVHMQAVKFEGLYSIVQQEVIERDREIASLKKRLREVRSLIDEPAEVRSEKAFSRKRLNTIADGLSSE